MNEPQFLLNRLTAIGQSLSQRDTALALIGLGSVGLDRDRLDRFSDLDFFVIVKPGHKAQYLEDLSWLSDIAPVAYYFLNTKDGYKLLYADGIFCEFAVFEEAELEAIPFAEGKVVWHADGVDERIAIPRKSNQVQEQPSTEWLLGEALTNLYVGLQRELRGEKLTATRFIQSYAVDHILALSERLHPPAGNARPDPFNRERRYEARYPDVAPRLPELIQGYERNRHSALAALTFLDQHFELNIAMKNAILALCGDPL